LRMSESEKDLLKKSKSGDIEAFERLIEGYQTRVFNIAYRMIRNHDDAADLAQEVFIKVYRYIKNFKEESSFSTWIFRITKNVCLDELRKRKNKHIISLDEEIKLNDGEVVRQIESKDDTPEMLAEKKEIRELINNAIDDLSAEHRIVIILRDIQGFSYEDISKIIECPEGTVKSRINRARKALKQKLKSKGELLTGEPVK
jgi:RNA polymerase sigma-70 factor (ECF subfamily)